MTYLVAAYLSGLGILGMYAIHVVRSLQLAGRLLRESRDSPGISPAEDELNRV